jgi:hypothetical protein
MVVKDASGKDIEIADELVKNGAQILADLKAAQQAAIDLATLKKQISDEKANAATKEKEAKGEYETLSAEAKVKVAQLETEKKEFATKKALTLESIKAKIKKENYLSLIDRSELEFDKDGNVTNADKVMEKFVKANPDLFGEEGDPGPSTGSNRTPAAKVGDKTFVQKQIEKQEAKRKPRFPAGWPTA